MHDIVNGNKVFLGTMMSDPSIDNAHQVVSELASRGFLTFISPSGGIMLVGDDASRAPSKNDIAMVDALRSDIEVMFALQIISKNLSAYDQAFKLITRVGCGGKS